jgi:hypothetical protein
MTRYITIEAITVPPGTVMDLSAEQASDRQAHVRALEGGAFEALDRLTFKAGEVLGVEGDLGVATMRKLEPLPSPVPSDSGAAVAPSGTAARRRRPPPAQE